MTSPYPYLLHPVSSSIHVLDTQCRIRTEIMEELNLCEGREILTILFQGILGAESLDCNLKEDYEFFRKEKNLMKESPPLLWPGRYCSMTFVEV